MSLSKRSVHEAVQLLYKEVVHTADGFAVLFGSEGDLAQRIWEIPGEHYKGRSVGSLSGFLCQCVPAEGMASRPVSERLRKSIRLAIIKRMGVRGGGALFRQFIERLDLGAGPGGRVDIQEKEATWPELFDHLSLIERLRIYAPGPMLLVDEGVLGRLARVLISKDRDLRTAIMLVLPGREDGIALWSFLVHLIVLEEVQRTQRVDAEGEARARVFLSTMQKDRVLTIWHMKKSEAERNLELPGKPSVAKPLIPVPMMVAESRSGSMQSAPIVSAGGGVLGSAGPLIRSELCEVLLPF